MNWKYLLFTFILSFCIWQCAEEQPKESQTDTVKKEPVDKGARIYKKYCIACHGADGKMGFSGAKDLTASTLSLTERKLIILNGKNTMTPFKKILDAKEINDVARYIEKFRTSGESN